MNNHASEGEFAELALAVYVEDLVAQKKVLYVGDPTSAAVERIGRAAHRVDVVSTRSRVRGTRRGGRVSSRRWPGEEDEGLWDVVIAPDLPAAGLADEDRLADVARWLAPGGVLVAGTPDPDGPEANASAIGYEDLFDLLDCTFEHVRMLGQAPFTGFSVVDFAPEGGEIEVTFDGSLLEGGGERAARYYALSSERDVALDGFAVVQVPSGAVPSAEARRRPPSGEGRVSELSARLREQQDALDASNVHAEELERELTSMRAELDRSQSELEHARARAEQARADRDALEETAEELRAEIDALSNEPPIDEPPVDEPPVDEPPVEEYARMETALQRCGQELSEARLEVERRGTLVRDLVEELREIRGGAPGIEPSAKPAEPEPAPRPSAPAPSSAPAAPGKVELDDAAERALRAEADKADLSFRLDEVRGELAMAERRCAQELEEMQRLEAALRGTVRGLNARLSEVIELHQQTQARLALAEDDRAAAEAQNRRLVRELAESREHLELEIARAEVRGGAEAVEPSPVPVTDEPAAAPVADEELSRLRAIEASAAAREGALLGALMQAREEAAELASNQREGLGQAEQAREALVELEHRVEGMRAGYEARVSELVRELDDVAGQSERALIQAGELRSRADSKEQVEAALRGEIAGVRFRLADREAAADALRGRVEELSEALDAAKRAPATVEYARDTDDEARVAELAAALGTRDALVGRLQRELADAAERRRALERRLDEHASKLGAVREELESSRSVSDVRDEEIQRELADVSERLERSERERERALEGLEEARGILAELALDIPVGRGGAARREDGASARELRDRLARLDAEAADREVLLRSLTAQLQERDDRLRALERTDAPERDGEDPRGLQQKLLEMEERVARLTEELEHERAARRRAESPPS